VSSPVLFPENEPQIAAIVAEHARVLAIGNRSKPPLSRSPDVTLLSLSNHTGIIEYEPSEFTFTARAGTRIRDLVGELAERRQYLPFDPPLADAGATLAGTVAAGLSGPGRFRFGGVRDFLLGARLLCGDGRWVNVGGKVVKNAAGFDVPKLLVGSLGRFGVISELTFKVFPQPPATATLRVVCGSHEQALQRIGQAAASRWELDAIEYCVREEAIYLRLGGPADVNESVAKDIAAQWGHDAARVGDAEATRFWHSINELSFGHVASEHFEFPPSSSANPAVTVVKVPTTPREFHLVRESLSHLESIELHLSVAGATTWIRCADGDATQQADYALRAHHLLGLCLLGSSEPNGHGSGHTASPWLGEHTADAMQRRVKTAMDPSDKFPSFDYPVADAVG